jgi:hypothetical protein
VNKKKVAFCRLLGGYGRVPVDTHILSAESLVKANRDGNCITIAEVPFLDPDTKKIAFEMVKVFAPAVKHPRETASPIDHLAPQSPK